MCAKSLVDKDEFFKILKGYKQKIWPIVEEHISIKPIPTISSLKMPEMEKFFWKQIADYPLRGGKYIRSALVLMTCEALGGTCEDAVFTAAAMELSQNWILIHDDVEDNSAKRRGKPTLHLRYSINHAINAGDGLHIIMWKVLSRNLERLDVDRCSLIWNEFYDMMLRTSAGQTAELALRNSLELTLDDVYYILDGKTGYYTVAGPMRLGAVIAGYDPRTAPELFQNINEFGLNLGRAFQIVDDLLDVTSDFEGLKELGSDIQEGKRSVLLVKLLQRADQFDLPRVLDIMNKPQGMRNSEEIRFIITLLDEYGIIEEARKLANDLAENSRQILKKIPLKNNSAKVFDKFVQYLVERTF
ncbi:MAG: polyprenyl synthetase family protein [Candidatus Odinarchaeota archaeon]